MSDHLTEQRNTHLLSDDAKIAEITKLRNDVATANDEKTRALKDAQISGKTLEYTNHQYRVAQDAATRAQNCVSDLEKQVKQLTHAASGQPAKLKALHLDRQYENLAKQIKALKSENAILKATLKQKDEELQRAKMSGNRMGVGTRATSATPRPRSRAASPMMGGRLSNLRNG
jgi:chromosome segregation ATPase